MSASAGQPKAFSQEIEENFNLIELFASYVNKPEVTAISPRFLVSGSKNVLIDYGQRVISRNGYTLYGQANTGAGGIKSSYDWESSTVPHFSLRAYDHTLEFDMVLPTGSFLGQYNTLLTGFRSPYFSFAKVLDFNEQQDVLLFVNGDAAKINRWGGGVAKVASSTSTTLTKQGVLTSKTNIAFNASSNPGTAGATITDSTSSGSFKTAGFAAGDILSVSGSASNSTNFTIASVSADGNTITLINSDVLVTEAAGPSITMYNQTGPTWKSARFLSTISGRAITYKGVTYTYTGGESTDTLTGLTSFPAVTAGDSVWQTPDSFNLPSAITSPFPLFYPNLIGVQLNMVFIGSEVSQMMFASKNNDYTNWTVTSPRAQGDPVQQPLTGGPMTCIVPMDNDRAILNVQNTLLFGSGVDGWDQIDFHMSADNTAELLRIIRLKTATGSGLISRDAIGNVKNAVVYISREPALDFLGEANLEALDSGKNKPISDPIKNDFDSYDFTNAHIKYWKRAIYIAVPASGVVLIYDMMRNLWQPPQTIPVSRFAIINDALYGHSAVTNETYKLFTGTDDNGTQISQVARFAYNNGGSRQRLKNLTEYWTEGYITANAELDFTIYFGFEGAEGDASMTILGNDSTVVDLQDATPTGDEPLGVVPLGGESFSPVQGLPGAGVPLSYFRQIDTATQNDYTQHFVEYTMNTLGGQFAIVAHGSNQFDAGTVDISRKK